MKKLTLTIAIILGMATTTFADGGGLFNRGNNARNGASGYSYFSTDGISDIQRDNFDAPLLPMHGETENQDAPLGSGIVALMSLGAAYMVAKKRREE